MPGESERVLGQTWLTGEPDNASSQESLTNRACYVKSVILRRSLAIEQTANRWIAKCDFGFIGHEIGI
jgi:hypothetical protein